MTAVFVMVTLINIIIIPHVFNQLSSSSKMALLPLKLWFSASGKDIYSFSSSQD